MNILIIGIGNIGKSHLNGLLKSKIKKTIYLYDSNKINIKGPNIINLKTFPKNKKFFLVIIATNVKERFTITKKLLDSNKVHNLLLEKYIFQNPNEFEFFEQTLLKKVKNKCLVNCWGKILLKIFKLKPTKEIININVKVNSDSFITSFIHFLQIFYYLTNKQNSESFISSNFTKVFNSKRVGYNELNGKFIIKNKLGSSLIYESKKFKNGFDMTLKTKNFSSRIVLNDNFQLFFYNKKKVTVKKFPLSSFTTNNLLNELSKYNKANSILPSYKEVAPINKIILDTINIKIKGKSFT